MAAPVYSKGEVLLAFLVFSGGQGAKRRPVLVVHDFGDADLLVVPITSQRARVGTDLVLSDWKSAGLKLPSTVRTEKLATIEKSCVARRLGTLLPEDFTRVTETLATVFKQILERSE
ncbi:MAG: type II toxin-antitoxin system PemK/MazF family toxin [Verrucomicrobia bacterium]|nr:type II toxin-antitoxin system PemK/MazF family toxin [Verrucomicrobiota bacterium]